MGMGSSGIGFTDRKPNIFSKIWTFIVILAIVAHNSILTSWSFAKSVYAKRRRTYPQFVSRDRTILGSKTTNSTKCIVYIHGRGDNVGQFNSIANIIRDTTDFNYLLVNLDQRDNPVHDDVIKTRDQIYHHFKSLLDKGLDLDITLVGISKGGVTAASLIANHCGDKRVHYSKLITIASPLNGTVLANYAFWTNAKADLSFGNIHAQNVKFELANLASDGKLRTYHVTNQFDNIVIPANMSAYKFTSSKTYKHRNLTSHNAIQDHPTVVAKVVEWIKED
jgi:triacylglycerol esterase/lipase EstA (alpha/beta hydrolase family)